MEIVSAIAFAGGYFAGAIPFGLLLARAAGKGDLRKIGSGNIGATNALRAGGPALGAATLLLDMAKGAGAVLIAARFGPQAALAAGAGAFIGHLLPVWLNFRGGKGVATFLGVAAAAFPPSGAAAAVAWLGAAGLTRYSSVGGIAAALAAPAAAAAGGRWYAAALFAAMAAMLIHRHRPNIARLRAGTEPKIGARPTPL